MELESLVIPQVNQTEEAGKLIMDLPRLWKSANEEEKRKLLLTTLDAVYIDTKETKSVIAIKPTPPFNPVLQVAASRKGPNINIINEPLKGSSLFLVETGVGWW
jgi:site-specific DNA recombinase